MFAFCAVKQKPNQQYLATCVRLFRAFLQHQFEDSMMFTLTVKPNA